MAYGSGDRKAKTMDRKATQKKRDKRGTKARGVHDYSRTPGSTKRKRKK